MGGGSKAAVLDDDAILKRERNLKRNEMGRSLLKKTMNTKKARNAVMQRSAYLVGGSGIGDAFSVDSVMNHSSNTSILEQDELSNFIMSTLAVPQKESLRVRPIGTHHEPEIAVDKQSLGRLKTDLVGEFNSVSLPRRPLGPVNSDQVLIERAMCDGFAYVPDLDGSGIGSKKYCESKGLCTCPYLASSMGSTQVKCDQGFPDFMHAIPYKGPLIGDGVTTSNNVGMISDSNFVLKPDMKREDMVVINSRLPWETPIDFLRALEVMSFVEWRKALCQIEEEESLAMTPYERNVEYWRQLWRVVESTDLVIQVLDGRDPLFFFSPDVVKMARSSDPLKQVLVVINKADYIPEKRRDQWKTFFKEANLEVIFFSALHELNQMGHTTINDDHLGKFSVIRGFRARRASTSSEEEELSEDEDSGDVTLGERTESTSSSDEPDNEFTTDVALGQERGDDILNSKALRQYLCQRRIDIFPQIQRRRDCVNIIRDFAERRTLYKEYDEWIWWRNGIVQKEYEAFIAKMKAVAEEKELTASMKTSKATPNWKIEQMIREESIQSAVEKKIVARHGGGIGLTNEPNFSELEFKISTVGYPNVGKSSLINALLLGVGTNKCRRLGVSSTPGKTKHFQTLIIPLELDENPINEFWSPTLDLPLKLLDCPGLVFPSIVANKEVLALNAVVRIGQMKSRPLLQAIELIIHRCGSSLSFRYGTPFGRILRSDQAVDIRNAWHFCNDIALKRGHLRRKGEGDVHEIARTILKDYCHGYLLYCANPPGVEFEVETAKYESDLFQNPAQLFSGAGLFNQSSTDKNSEGDNILGTSKIIPSIPQMMDNPFESDNNYRDMADLKEFLEELSDDGEIQTPDPKVRKAQELKAAKAERRKGLYKKKGKGPVQSRFKVL